MVSVISFNSFGLITLKYSASIKNLTIINSTIIEILIIKMGPDQQGNKTIIGWNCTRISDREQDIQIGFAKPGEISNDKVKTQSKKYRRKIGFRLGIFKMRQYTERRTSSH